MLVTCQPPSCHLYTLAHVWWHCVDLLCRHLQIVLVSAERAWAHAMQLKQEAQNDEAAAAKKRHTALRRLRKASTWASELARIAGKVCDNRSQVEADAYASWMAGNLLMEKESDWQRALAAYTRAR